MTQKILAVGSMLFMLSMFGTSVSFAYLTDMELAQNKIEFTENILRIEEEFEPPDEISPGSVIKKSPGLINESDIPVYVRMSARFSNIEAERICMPLKINVGWTLHSDGYYYYHRQLNPKERTTSLFDSVIIREDISKEELLPFDILIYAESIQCYDMDKEEAWAFYEKSSL